MNPQTLSPASAAADSPPVDAPADPADLPAEAPPGGTLFQTAEQMARNVEHGKRAAERGEGYFDGEVYSDGPDRPLRKRMHLLDLECDGRLTADGRRERPAWTQADIADDGTARLLDRDGTWRDWSPDHWSPPTRRAAPSPAINAPATGSASRRRPRSGRATRPASSGRTRGSRRSTSRSSSRSGDSGDGEPGESEPRYCLCGCGADLTGRRPQTAYDKGACEARYRRKLKGELERLAGLSDGEREAIWRRFDGGEILLELFIGAVALSELLVPDASGPASKRVRQTVAA